MLKFEKKSVAKRLKAGPLWHVGPCRLHNQHSGRQQIVKHWWTFTSLNGVIFRKQFMLILTACFTNLTRFHVQQWQEDGKELRHMELCNVGCREWYLNYMKEGVMGWSYSRHRSHHKCVQVMSCKIWKEESCGRSRMIRKECMMKWSDFIWLRMKAATFFLFTC